MGYTCIVWWYLMLLLAKSSGFVHSSGLPKCFATSSPKCRLTMCLASSDQQSVPKRDRALMSVACSAELAINHSISFGNSKPRVPANSFAARRTTQLVFGHTKIMLDTLAPTGNKQTAFVIPVSCRNALVSYAGYGYAQLHLLCWRSHPDQRLQWRKSISAPSMALVLEGWSSGKEQSVDHASVDTATSPQ